MSPLFFDARQEESDHHFVRPPATSMVSQPIAVLGNRSSRPAATRTLVNVAQSSELQQLTQPLVWRVGKVSNVFPFEYRMDYRTL